MRLCASSTSQFIVMEKNIYSWTYVVVCVRALRIRYKALYAVVLCPYIGCFCGCTIGKHVRSTRAHTNTKTRSMKWIQNTQMKIKIKNPPLLDLLPVDTGRCCMSLWLNLRCDVFVRVFMSVYVLYSSGIHNSNPLDLIHTKIFSVCFTLKNYVPVLVKKWSVFVSYDMLCHTTRNSNIRPFVSNHKKNHLSRFRCVYVYACVYVYVCRASTCICKAVH